MHFFIAKRRYIAAELIPERMIYMSKTTATTVPTIEEQAKKSRAAYQREWRKKNPEKTKQYNMTYWMKKAQEQAAADAE